MFLTYGNKDLFSWLWSPSVSGQPTLTGFASTAGGCLLQFINGAEKKHFAVPRVERHRNVVPHYRFDGVKQPD